MSWIPPELPLMYVRHYDLVAALAGLRATGVPLVGLAGETPYAVGWSGDSPGLYYFVPLLVRATGLPLETALLLFFGGALAAALVLGAVGWWAYARTLRWRLAGIGAMLVLCYWSLWIGDSYTLATAVPIATVPILLLLWRRATSRRLWLVALAATGLAAGVAAVVRSEAGVVAPVFALALTLLQRRERLRWRIALAAVLLLGLSLPSLGMRRVERQRDAYLARALPGYVPPVHRHALWHGVYLGFGFLNNPYGIAFKDGVAIGRVAALSPGTPSYTPRYEAVLRREVVRLALAHPEFVARTVTAKAGTIALYLLVFANLGLVAALRARKPAELELAFAAALLVAALPGLLVLPRTTYLEGFTAMSALFGLVSLDWAARARPAAGPPVGAGMPAGVTA